MAPHEHALNNQQIGAVVWCPRIGYGAKGTLIVADQNIAMTRTNDKSPIPRRHTASALFWFIATAICGLAVLWGLLQLRRSLQPSEHTSPIPTQALLDRPPDCPRMHIAPGDLSRVGRTRHDNGLEMIFCWCPPGSFHMGRLPSGTSQNLEAHPVTVTLTRDFWIGKFEVTQAQWQRVMGTTVREQRAKDPGQPRPVGDGTKRDHVGEGPDFPIYYTSHAEAEDFCRKLTEAERATGRLESGWEYRLPTEAQWEFACRAGTPTATAFGDALGSTHANFDGTDPLQRAPVGPYLHETTPVGRYPANGWGIHDMHGNVWEWCLDGYTKTPKGGTDPLEQTNAATRVYRGGCWHNPGSMCLSTTRGSGDASDRGSGLGFRVALVRISGGKE